MVLVVVLVHAVAADEMQRRIFLGQLGADRLDVSLVAVVVDRIGFLLTHDAAVRHIFLGRQTDLRELSPGQRHQLVVGRRPQPVALEAEVFEPEASEFLVRHHLRRPGTEVLDAADLDARLVDINPVVGEQIRLVDDQRDGEEVAIAQLVGGILATRLWREACTSSRIGADEMTCRDVKAFVSPSWVCA